MHLEGMLMDEENMERRHEIVYNQGVAAAEATASNDRSRGVQRYIRVSLCASGRTKLAPLCDAVVRSIV